MALPGDLLADLKLDLTHLLRTYVEEKYLAVDITGKVFSAWETNWYQRPPAVIKKNGNVQTTGFTINYSNGSVTFASAPLSTDVITAEFYFQPISDEALRSILISSTSTLATLLGQLIIVTVDLDQRFESLVRDIAFSRVFWITIGEAANYHRWQIDGELVDKSRVAGHYATLLKQKNNEMMAGVERMRIALLSTGTNQTTTGLGIT